MSENMAPIRILSCQTNRFSQYTDCCHRKGAAETLAALRAALAAAGLEDQVRVEVGPCLGYCSVGPNLRIVRHDLLNGVTPADIPAVIDRLRDLLVPIGTFPRDSYDPD